MVAAQDGARTLVTVSLFGRHCVDLTAFVDHGAHLADAFGALSLALVASEDFARTAGARLDGEGHITLAKTVTVADVHEKRNPEPNLRMVLYSIDSHGCKSFAFAARS